jgi:hypothetical protein
MSRASVYVVNGLSSFSRLDLIAWIEKLRGGESLDTPGTARNRKAWLATFPVRVRGTAPQIG